MQPSSPQANRPILGPGGLLDHSLIQSTLSLYGVYLANYALPLITVPYLARVLGPASWGILAIAQGLGNYVRLVVEYGFSLSATREVARSRDDRDRVAGLLAGVVGGQVALSVALLPVPLLAQSWVPVLREQPLLVWAAYFWAITQGASLVWLFQGLERMRFVAALDVGAKVLTTAGIFLFVKTPHDAAVVLVLQFVAGVLTLVIGFVVARREIPWQRPSVRETWSALRLGWSLFVFRSAVSVYTVGNAFILGLFATPTIVGYYSAAERISKALLGLLGPFGQVLYPRVSHLVRSAWEDARRLAQTGLWIMGAGGVLLGLVAYLGAPFLVRILLGPMFDPTVPVLRVLALLLPLIAVSNVLGIQWMLPLGLDHVFNRIILAAGVLNLGLAYWLAPRFAEMGMAWAVVIAEAFVTFAMYGYLRWRNLDPVRGALGMPGGVG
jgi:PST family polysaccharide transporter